METSLQQKMETLEKEIREKQKEITALKKQAAWKEVGDYMFKDWEGKDVSFYSLFENSDELLIIHNMGKSCVYCTLWADGFNGLVKPLNDRVQTVLVNNNSIEEQKEFAASRGWTFKMLSLKGNTFNRDLDMENEDGAQWPGVSTFVKKDEKVYRAGFDYFGPGDVYNSPWHLFELLYNGVNGWQPKYNY